MYDCVVFEHLGQLCDIREQVQEAASKAGKLVGFRFINPVESLNINTLKDLIVRDLHMPESYYEDVSSLICLYLKPGKSLKELKEFDIPIYVVGTQTLKTYSTWMLADLNIVDFVPTLEDAPCRKVSTLVVRDAPDGTYPNEVMTYDQSNLENLISLLQRNI